MHNAHRLGLVSFLALATACSAPVADVESDDAPVHVNVAPLLPNVVTNRYIVRLRDEVDAGSARIANVEKLGAVRGHVFKHTIHGFSVVNVSAAALEELRRDPDVLSVEEDKPMPIEVLQTNPGWGLDRLDDRTGLDSSYWYETTGSGVHIYVVDTGVRGDHAEFAGRIGAGANVFDSISPAAATVEPHGTGVASVAAGKTKGIARGAIVHPVRVGKGPEFYTSDVVAGIDWVTANAIKPAVLNSSHGGGHALIAAAYQRALQKGITVVRSAGNLHSDACLDASDALPGVIVVGATDSSDKFASFSDYGPCVALSAPGVGVSVATSRTATATTVADGTSFAAPYVAGIAALMLGRTPTLTPAEVKNKLTTAAWHGALSNLPEGTPNLLANSTATLVKPASMYINSGAAGELSTTYVWSDPSYLDGVPNKYVWQENVGGVWSTVSTRRTYTRYIAAGSYATIKLRVIHSIEYFGTWYPETTTFTSWVTPTLPGEGDLCTNPKLCE